MIKTSSRQPLVTADRGRTAERRGGHQTPVIATHHIKFGFAVDVTNTTVYATAAECNDTMTGVRPCTAVRLGGPPN